MVAYVRIATQTAVWVAARGLEIRIIVVDNERAIEGMALLACQNSLIVRVRGTGTIDSAQHESDDGPETLLSALVPLSRQPT